MTLEKWKSGEYLLGQPFSPAAGLSLSGPEKLHPGWRTGNSIFFLPIFPPQEPLLHNPG